MPNDVSVASAANAVARNNATEPTEAAQMLSQIMAVILNPDVPDSRVAMLLELQKQLTADQREMLFTDALSSAQGRFRVIDRRGKVEMYSKTDREYAEKNGGRMPPGAVPFMSTPYALWEDIVEEITAGLSAFGLTLTFEVKTEKAGEGSFTVIVVGLLKHREGHVQRAESPPLKHDATGAKNPIQAIQSTISYGKKMVAGLLTNFVSRGEDDEGSLSGRPVEDSSVSSELISAAETVTLTAAIEAQDGKRTPDDPGAAQLAICRAYNIPQLSDLPAIKFDECMQRLAMRAKTAAAEKKAPAK